MLGGIISGALKGAGNAAGSIADMTMQEQARSRLAQEQAAIEQQKMRLADELARTRAEWEVDLNGLGGKKVALAGATTKAETGALVDREERLAPVKTRNEVERAKLAKTAEGEVQRANEAAYATPEGRRALAGISAKAAAGESSASRASAAESTERATAARRVNKLYADLEKETDPAKREQILSRLEAERAPARSTGGGSRPGSFSDVVALTRVLDSQAQEAELRGDAEDAAALRRQSRELTRSITTAKGLPGGSAAGGGASEQAQAHSDAQAAISTGRISLEEANKRLQSRGFAPLPGVGGAPRTAPPVVPASKPGGVSILEGMNYRTLTQIANTPGHVNQRAAQEELTRRQNEPQVDMSGVGYGQIG